jgi:hypothetical protein
MKNKFSTRMASCLILGLTIFALFLGSCKNSDDEEEEQAGNGYKITLKVDGVAKEFASEDFPPFGSFTDNGKQYSASFAATGRASSVGLTVYDTKAIVKNDYSGLVITPTTGHNLLYGAVVSYAEGQDSYSTQSITNPTVQIKITEITATSVRGEFSGTLKSQNGKPDIIISKGEFYVQRVTSSN